MRRPHVYRCRTWEAVARALADIPDRLKTEPGEELWFRGVGSTRFGLLPTLFRWLEAAPPSELDRIEADLFFEFQARARELHERRLRDWDYLFFMRHHGIPTRILDWTDAFGVAMYFALESDAADAARPAVWVLNPYALNDKSWGLRDLVQPRDIGHYKATRPGEADEFWDYGRLMTSTVPWQHDKPVALYPAQINERMRAQRGWFTLFGNDTRPLEHQVPQAVARIDLHDAALPEARAFLAMTGLRPYSIYPDLDHLALELVAFHQDARSRRTSGPAVSPRRRTHPGRSR